MSPKEQSEAVRLLQEWFTRTYPDRRILTSDERDLLERTEKFLKLEGADPS